MPFSLGPTTLSSLTPSRLRSLPRPHFPPTVGERGAAPVARCCYEDLPDVEVRCTLLNELGDGLLGRHDGSALRMLSKADGSTDDLVGIILNTFPAFHDYVDLDAHGNPPYRGCEGCTRSTLGGRWSRAGPTRSPSGRAPCMRLRRSHGASERRYFRGASAAFRLQRWRRQRRLLPGGTTALEGDRGTRTTATTCERSRTTCRP
jgi:hypothetical protein